MGFATTNNEAEYEALLAGLAAMRKLEGKVVRVYCDSRLIVRQVQCDFEAKDSRMLWYLNQVKNFFGGFCSFTLEQVPRSKNSHADSLATLATISRENLPRIILVEDYTLLAYDVPASVQIHFTRMGPSWMDPLLMFLKNELLPEDKTRAEKVRKKAPRCW